MAGGLFAGKRVLVTGSTRGVGRAAAERFLEEGAAVVLHGRIREGAEDATRRLAEKFPSQVSAAFADLSRRGDIMNLVKTAGDLDILVNCAGIYEERTIAEADEDHWDRTIEVNLTSPWALSRAFADGLARRAGLIVNVSSDAGLLGYARSSAYCASKGALIGLTRALATELAPAVRAVCICPGPIDTDMMRENAQPGQWEAVPLLKRAAQPAEIAEAILFAASPNCSYQTGSVIVVDGGTVGGKRV